MLNKLLRIRYQIIRKLLPGILKDHSPEKKKGELVFCDYFNKKSWDGSLWDVGSSALYHPRRPHQWYGAPFLRGDKGVFTVKHNPRRLWVYQNSQYQIFPFETTRIRSVQKFKYGRFECRMSLPGGKHAWPAFWLWGAPWPPEIDVIEAYGRESGVVDEQEINLHWGGPRPFNVQMNPWRIKLGKRKFYEFALEWHPDKLDFFTNGIKVFTFRDKEILQQYFSQEMWIVVNHAIKQMVPKDYYSEFQVDYVRAYKLKSQND